jgi:hypothetical protein
MVACRAAEKGHCFTVPGDPRRWCCLDTGGPIIEAGTFDFWAKNAADAAANLPPGDPICVTWLEETVACPE